MSGIALDIGINVLGLVGVIPQFMQMGQDFLNFVNGRSTNAKDHTIVRVVLGQTTDKAASFSGNTPGVSLWDFNGSAIGYTDGSSKILAQGSFTDITIAPRIDIGNVDAEYISITNGGDDAICISGIAATFPDGSVSGFSTDVAAACGAPWAYSTRSVLNSPPTGDKPTPKCIWLDRDGSFGLPFQGMGIHLPSFTNGNKNLAESYRRNSDLMCKSGPRFRMYPKLRTEQSILTFQHPLVFLQNSTTNDPTLVGTDADPGFIIENPGILAADLDTGEFPGRAPEKRTVSERRNHNNGATAGTATSANVTASDSRGLTQPAPRPAMHEYLIISPNPAHSARKLCESGTSFGHSWVSMAEKLYCDMGDKSLYHLCSDNMTDCCMDIDTASFRACTKSSVRPPIKIVNGTTISSFSVRSRNSVRIDRAWSKGDMTYNAARVQTWS